jgi:hypothetical protein
MNCIVLKNGKLYWLSQEEIDLLAEEVNSKRFITIARLSLTLNVDIINSFGIHTAFRKSEVANMGDFRFENDIIYSKNINDNLYYSYTGKSWDENYQVNWERATPITDLISMTYDTI